MTHVHYKFSSKLSYDTVVFDGPHITLKDLKRQIMGKEKLRAGDCDLQITNAQTKEEYAEDEGLIPKGSSVIVRRVPIIGGGKSSSSSKTHNTERLDAQLHHAFTAVKSKDGQASTSVNPLFSKISNLADADVSEEDKIRVMLNQSAYDMNYSNKYGTALPSNYTCYRCGNTGHHIRNCPASVSDKSTEAPLRIKKSTGIPRSFMVEVDDPNIKGAMLTNCGRYAIPTIDAEAYAIGKKEKPPFLQQEQPKTETKAVTVPDELLCLICQELLSDAVVIPCCGNSYCDDCIRSALLDSEDHICPNCSQLDVSPDTLIANKFLRQAVNNFKKERGYTRGVTRRCSTSQSQNPTPTTSPVPTPPPPAVQSQPQKPLQSTNSQQEPLVHHPQAADSPPLSGNPPTTTSPSTACNTPNDSLQTEQSCRKTPEKEAEAETHDDLAAAAPSVPVSNKDATAAPSQLIPLVNHTTVAEQPQTAGVSQQQSSLGSIPGQAGPPASWGSSSSSSVCPTGGWTESPQLTSSPSSSYSAAIPPLFPYPLFHTNHSAHQSHSTYPPGYPPTTPIWTIPCPQGAPIPSLCSTSTSSIPSLVPKEWYSHQRKTKERSPQRGSTYGRSSSRSNSKSKSSRSYSRSSSRSGSRSRSRSQGRSRPRSPYSHHRDRHHRSHPSRSYSYGYKRPRSPTPSSSSSPQVDHRSRSKSPSDHRKNRHRSHHHAKKSASSSQSSKRRDERSGREAGGSGAISATSSFTSHSSHTSNMELDRERYLKWKKEYKEWCDKYLSSYVGHFQQLPFPFVNLPPPPPHWEGIKNSVSQVDDRSPSSQSSTDSHSTSSQSSSDSRSSLSLTSNDSQSPPSHLSSDGRSMRSEDKAQQRARHQRQRDKEAELHGRSKGGKRMKCEKKYEKRRMRKHEDGREEESSSPDAAEPTDDRENDTRPQTCGDSGRDKATASDKTLKPAYTSLRPDKSLDKDCGKSSERGNWEREKVSKRSKDSGSRRDVVRQHKIRPSNEEDRVDSGRYRSPGGSKAPDTRSEKNRKRKGENLERSETREAESPDPFDRKEQKTEKKKERKTLPPTEREIWEGGMTVKPQKKISININLEGKRKETTDKQQSNPGESKEEKLNRGHGEGERREFGVEEKGLLKDTVKPVEAGVRPSWEKATFRDDKRETWEKISNAGEKNKDGEGDGVDLWHFAFKELKEGKEQWEGEEMKTSKEDERRSLTRKEETEERLRKGSGGQEMRELVQHFQEENRRNQTEEWKPNETLMEVVKRRTKTEEDDTMRFTLSSNNSSSCDEQRTKFKTLEEFIQNRGEKEDQLVLGQVPWSKRDKYEEEKQNEGGPVVQPSPVVTPTSRETEGENELTRLRSVDGERERGIVQRVNSREKDKNLTLANLDRGVAPSSGKDGTDSTLCTDREKERGMEVEKWRGRERSRDRQKERRRSKEQEKGRERGKEREDSSAASALKKNLPSYGHLSYSTSQDTGEMRERQRGGDLDREKRSGSGGRERSSMSKADKHAQKIYKDSLDKHRDKKHHRDHYKDQDRPTGTHWSSSSFSHTQNNPSPEMKRSDSKEKEGERKRNKVGKVIKESKGERESRGRETEREGGRRWRDEADQLSTWTKWEGGRDLEEGERPSSSSSSSTSQENSEDDRRKERMTKQKHHKTDKNQSALEAREEEDELKKHKRMMKSKRNADGREEDCGGEVDDRWKEEEGRIKLCPVTLF